MRPGIGARLCVRLSVSPESSCSLEDQSQPYRPDQGFLSGDLFGNAEGVRLRLRGSSRAAASLVTGPVPTAAEAAAAAASPAGEPVAKGPTADQVVAGSSRRGRNCSRRRPLARLSGHEPRRVKPELPDQFPGATQRPSPAGACGAGRANGRERGAFLEGAGEALRACPVDLVAVGR